MFSINKEALDIINEGKNTPKKIGEDKEFDLEYVATDVWHGYYNAIPTKESKWIRIDSNWITGNYSDTGENSIDKIEDILKKQGNKYEKEGKDMIVVFLPTSDGFSNGVTNIAFDIFIRDKK